MNVAGAMDMLHINDERLSRFYVSEAEIDSALERISCFRDMPPTSGVYLMVNIPTGRMYIGRSKNMRKRVACHMSELRSGVKGELMQEDFDKHGEASMRFAVVVERSDPLEVYWCELQAIKIILTRDNYNRFGKDLAQCDPAKDYKVRKMLGGYIQKTKAS